MKINSSKYLIAIILFSTSCTKWLDTKPDKKLVIPAKLEDVQALLDNNYIMNAGSLSLGEASADDYWLNSADYEALQPNEQEVYKWGKNIYGNGFPNDWSSVYNPVYYSNIALEYIETFGRNNRNKEAWDNVKGSALFFRSKSFLEAAWIWCNVYDDKTVQTDMGLPLRLSSDFNEKSVRSSLGETYQRITSDLKIAAALLPVKPVHVMRPSRVAAYGLLARTYLSMRKYDSCYHYATLAYELKHQLIDYNDVPVDNSFSFEPFNGEVILHSTMTLGVSNLYTYYAKVDSLLYESYDLHDLRKAIFYEYAADHEYTFKGSYGQYDLFNGIATDELYLMKAESAARLNKTEEAMSLVNELLKHRITTGFFMPLKAANSDEALKLVLRGKEKGAGIPGPAVDRH